MNDIKYIWTLPMPRGNYCKQLEELFSDRSQIPKAAYYLIQRRDSQQTPLTASLITQFRRQSQQLFRS